MQETHKRSVIKAVSWRFLGTLITGLVVYVFTGKLSLSFGIAGVEFFAKIIAYYIHERIWNGINRGKYVPEAA